jgi:hypothetical protein
MTKSVRLAQVRTCLRGQCGPGEVKLEQRVGGSFFEFSLSHPARSETAVVQQRGRPRRSVTANQAGLVSVSTPQSSEAGCAAKRSRIDSGLERPVLVVQLPGLCAVTSGYGLLG